MSGARFVFFALAAACGIACGQPSDSGAESATSGDEVGSSSTLRVVASNLTSGSNQSYDPGEGARILQALKPDVALLQELNYGDGTDAALRTFVDATFGPAFHVFREADAAIPNGVVSRYPIVAHGEWTDPGASGTRDFAWVRIDLPGDRDLWAVSVHLKAKSSEMETRTKQAEALVTAIRGTVREGDYLVIGGDMNTEAVDEPCITTLGAVVDVAGPFPADAEGNGGTSSARSKPYDWVLANSALRAREVDVTLGKATFHGGLVFDTRTFPALADVPPAQPNDSAASNMQHMAVVRDFSLRENAAR